MDEARFSIFESEIGTQIRLIKETYRKIEERKKGRYHAELLRRMSIFIRGVRPALLSDEAYKLLDNLRAFRRFFRHAYGHEIELRKIKIVLDDALRLKEIY